MSDMNDLNDTDFAARAIAEARARADAAIADAEALRAGTVALRAELNDAREILRAIDDAIGGVREGEALVDAVRRVAREGVRSEEVEALRKRVEELEFTRDELAGILRDVRAALGIQRGDSVVDAAREARPRAAAEMRERAAAIVAKYTGYAAADVRSLPIAKTPAAPASEDAGEAVRRRATEAAGAGDSVARESASAQDTCGEPNEDARVHYGSVSWIPMCNESPGHNGDHVARGINGVGAIRWPRTCAREDATCDVQGNAQAEIARLRAEIDRVASALLSRDLEVAAWRDTTGCSTPEQVSERAARIRQAAELLRD